MAATSSATPAYKSDAHRRRERVKRALANPVFFINYYFGAYDPRWPKDGDHPEPMAPFAAEMVMFATLPTHLGGAGQYGTVEMPPEYMKTTLLSQGLPLWETARSVAFNEVLYGMLLSEEEQMAANNLGVLKWHILYNDRLRHDFRDHLGRPLLRPSRQQDNWREDSIIVERGFPSKDPTWQAKGLDSKGIQGRRITRLRADDLITPKNAFSVAMRKRALDLWDLEVETRLVADAKAIVCGNFQDPKDLLQTLSKRPGWRALRRPSISRPDDRSKPPLERDLWDSKRAVYLWPEVWPPDRLRAVQRRTPQRFRRVHLLDATAEAGDKLKVEWMTLIEPKDTPLPYCKFTLSIDGAPGGETDDLDFFVITVLAHLPNGMFDIVEQKSVRTDTPKQVKMVGHVHDRYNRVGSGVTRIYSQKVAMDAYLRGAITTTRPDLERKLDEVSTGTSLNAKLARLESLGPYAESGTLRCWDTVWDTLTSSLVDQHQELTLRDEWKDFPNGTHDDRLDSLDINLRGIGVLSGPGDRVVTLTAQEA
jgi:hypothetical protein